jgi:predicted dienelactone hydrolase
MRQLLLLIACLFVQSLTAQNFQSGFRQITFTDPARSNRAIPIDIYYPATSSGTNTPLAPGTQTFPVVVFGHGFVIPTSSYKWLGDTLSKYGFIAVFPTTESSFSPNHGTFGADITFLASRVTSLNDSSGSFFFGRVKKRAAVGGHSMGGGSSFLAAASANAVIHSIFNFAAAETNPSAQQAAAQVNLPALIFSGTADCIVPPSTQKGMYNAIPYPCKTYINLTGGLHCHFSNNDATCSFGQLTSGCNSSSVNAQVIFQKTTSLLIPFLNLYLNEDCNSSNLFNDRYSSLTGAAQERVCTSDPNGCAVTNVNDLIVYQGIQLFPNPVRGNASLQLKGGGLTKIQSYTIYSMIGERIFQGVLTNRMPPTIHLNGLQPGYYLVVLQLDKQQRLQRRLKVE